MSASQFSKELEQSYLEQLKKSNIPTGQQAACLEPLLTIGTNFIRDYIKPDPCVELRKDIARIADALEKIGKAMEKEER